MYCRVITPGFQWQCADIIHGFALCLLSNLVSLVDAIYVWCYPCCYILFNPKCIFWWFLHPRSFWIHCQNKVNHNCIIITTYTLFLKRAWVCHQVMYHSCCTHQIKASQPASLNSLILLYVMCKRFACYMLVAKNCVVTIRC